MRHLGGGDAEDAVGRLDEIEAERLRDLVVERALGRFDVERHLAAEEAVGAEPAEHQVGIGDGRLGAAEAVADRTRRRRRRSPARRAARCRARPARSSRRRCRPPGCRSSASGSAGRWRSRRSARRRSSARRPDGSRRPWRWCRPCRTRSRFSCRWSRTAPWCRSRRLPGPIPACGCRCAARLRCRKPAGRLHDQEVAAEARFARCCSISVR